MRILNYKFVPFERYYNNPPQFKEPDADNIICEIGCWPIKKREAEAILNLIGFYEYDTGIPFTSDSQKLKAGDGQEIRFHPRIKMVWIDSQLGWVKYSTLMWAGRILEHYKLIKRRDCVTLKERFFRLWLRIILYRS